MFVLGITGGIGAGKSSVASLCREAGLTVLDADEIARHVTEPGGSALPAIKEAFGPKFVDEEQGMLRQKMSDLVFENKPALDLLSQIVHAKVQDESERRVKELTEAGIKAVVLDFPIPVKRGFLELSDYVVSVWADDDIRVERLKNRGMKEHDAKRRMRVQMSREDYLKRADEEITNNGNFNQLKAKVQELLERELGNRGIPFKTLA